MAAFGNPLCSKRSSLDTPVVLNTLSGIAGNVNSVGFSADGSLLFAAAGEPGLFGELSVWSTTGWNRRLHDARPS